MKNQFRKIRRSRTRRLTLEAITSSSQKKPKTGESNRSKSFDQYSAPELVLDAPPQDNLIRQENGIDSNNINDMEKEQEINQKEDNCEKTPVRSEKDPDKFSDEECETPKVRSPAHKEDIRELSQEEIVNRILAEASPVALNYVRRKKKHG